jgi:ubiquinone/menaquinone biosynthesis C-methylase UbiE
VDHFRYIYTHNAQEYHQMIAPEDTDGNLLPALLRVDPLAGERILDLGGGTGRIPLLLAPLNPQIVSLDLHRAMLLEQSRQRALARQRSLTRQRALASGAWSLVQADMRWLPIQTGWAGVVIAGWAVGHMRSWYWQDWQEQIGRVLAEMQRAVRPGGALIILETLTTGSLLPAPPTIELAEYYAWLEKQWGFTRDTIATDFQFESIDQAVEYTQFFFGPKLAAEIRSNGWSRLPEWTGVWSKRT